MDTWLVITTVGVPPTALFSVTVPRRASEPLETRQRVFPVSFPSGDLVRGCGKSEHYRAMPTVDRDLEAVGPAPGPGPASCQRGDTRGGWKEALGTDTGPGRE